MQFKFVCLPIADSSFHLDSITVPATELALILASFCLISLRAVYAIITFHISYFYIRARLLRYRARTFVRSSPRQR